MTMQSPLAVQIIEAHEFNKACNEAAEHGRAEFADFDDALSTFRLLGGATPDLLNAALATEAPHRALYRLGKNPGEAQRILALSPVKQALEIARLERAVAKPVDAPTPRAPKTPENETPAPSDDRLTPEYVTARKTALMERRIGPQATAAHSMPKTLNDDLPMQEWARRRMAHRRYR